MVIRSDCKFARWILYFSKPNDLTDDPIPRADNDYADTNGHSDIGAAIEFTNANLSWDIAEDATVILQDIDLKIPKGKLTIVVGEVGGGKTALVSALLNEMHVVSVSSALAFMIFWRMYVDFKYLFTLFT